MREIKNETRALNRSVQEIQNDLENINSQQQVLRLDLEALTERIDGMEASAGEHEASSEVAKKLQKIEDNVEMLEQYSRKTNVLLYGVSEKSEESKVDSKKIVCDILNDHIDITDKSAHVRFSEGDIASAHRLGKVQSKRTRPFIVI